MSGTSLMLHCGATPATLADLRHVDIPRTRTHRPIPYADSVEFLIDVMYDVFGLSPRTQEMGLQRGGAQMFAKFNYDVGDAKRNLSVGLRNGYDKSLKCKLGGGASMLICDNLCFSASGFVAVRKNTTFAWDDFKRLVWEHIPTLMGQYKATVAECERLESIPCSLDRGYAMLGVAQGRKLLTPTQANVAFADWRSPRYSEFADRNLWSLYNATTEGLKKGAVGHVIERHVNMHDYFLELADKPAPKQIIDVPVAV